MTLAPSKFTFRILLWIAVLQVSGLPTLESASAADPIVIAHRGASGYLPEHTLAAASLAYGLGADYVEQDVVLTRDDVPVVLHDIHIDTVTDVAKRFPNRHRSDGRFYAIDFTLDELQSLRVNERIDPRSGQRVFPARFPLGKSTFRIVTLAEQIELIQGLNASTQKSIGIYPEIKQPSWHRENGHDISKTVIGVLRHYGYTSKQDACYLQCFEAAELKRIRHDLGVQLKLIQLLSQLPTVTSDDEQSRQTAEVLRQIAGYADGIGPSLSLICSFSDEQPPQAGSLVKLAHQYHLQVHPYTIRSDALPSGVADLDSLMQLLVVDLQIDGMFTDHPDHCAQWLRAKH